MMSSPLPPRPKPQKRPGQNIKVFVRCRPMNTIEKVSKSSSLVDCQAGRDVVVRERPQDKYSKTFSFDKVFGPESKQLDVYKSVAKPLVDEVLNGFNCTIFAYGQTGTGKTFTMEGEKTENCTSWQDDPLSGIIPRCVNHLFDELRIQKLEFTMRVSFLELYNEELFDLLSAQDDMSKLRLYEDASRKGSCIIQGLEEVLVRSKDDVYAVIEKGSMKRQTAATLMNAHSSRSHTVFTVTIHIKENNIDGDELLKTGKLHLVDLAGSENIGRSGAVDKRAREAGNINMSLLTLGRVITSLVEKAPHVPYRESKLTRLLQDALGGRTKTSIIATVSPASINLEETLSTLDYAHRAKNITNKPEVNQKLNKKELIGEYTEEIERLRRDLMAMREKNGVYLANENYQEMIELDEQQKKEIAELMAKIRSAEEELEKQTELFESTKQQLEETEGKLSTTRHHLTCTKKMLETTAQDRDEQKHLVGVQTHTEENLQKQGQSLIAVAEVATSHISLLHEKIDRKRQVEEHNRLQGSSFEGSFGKHVGELRENIKEFKTDHSASLRTLAEKNLTRVTAHQEAMSVTASDIRKENSALMTLLNDVKKVVGEKVASTQEVCSSLAAQSVSFKETETETLHQFVRDIVPSLETITSKCSLIHSTLSNFTQEFSKEMQLWQTFCAESNEVHLKRSEKMCTLLENKLTQSAESFQSQMERQLAIHKQSVVKNEEETQQMIQSISALLTSRSVSSKQHIADTNEHSEQTLSECRTYHSQTLGHYGELSDAVRQEKERVLVVFKQGNEVVDNSKERVNKLTEDVNQYASDISSCEEQVKERTDLHSTSTLSSLERHSAEQVKQHSQVTATMSDLKESFAQLTDSASEKLVSADQLCDDAEAASAQQTASAENMKKSVEELADVFEEKVSEWSLEMSERQNELHLLFNEKMNIDKPTGLTPSRQDYSYPRSLVATSPHERILRRYRTQHSSTLGLKTPLPLPTDDEDLSYSYLSLDGSPTDQSENVFDGHFDPKTQSMNDLNVTPQVPFVKPSAPSRLSARDDNGKTSGIPAPVCRSASASSISYKENKSRSNSVTRKKTEGGSKSSSIQSIDKLETNTTNTRSRRILGSHN